MIAHAYKKNGRPVPVAPASQQTNARSRRQADEVKRAALRIIAGYEDRTQAAVARDLGVTPANISKAVKTMRRRLRL